MPNSANLSIVDSAPVEGQRIPFNIDAEKALLGALMLENRLLEEVNLQLRDEHFHEPLHGRIFAQIRRLSDLNMVANPITLRPLFDADAAITELGGASYLLRLTEDPSVVIAAGGDGTIRVVAGVLAGTGVPMGILPLGTGNLLARNLELPIDSLWNLVSIAVTGRDRRIDVGWVEAPEPDAEFSAALAAIDPEARSFAGREPFFVISGMGFDAQVMDDTDADLKRIMGWSAYIVAGVRHLNEDRVNAVLTTGNGENRNQFEVEARSILFANCGSLPGGMVLAPDARIDDGWLDIGVLDTRGGLLGWGDLVRRIGMRQFGLQDKLFPEAGSLEFRRARNVDVQAQAPELVQADGDPLGWAQELSVSVDRGAVIVRVG